MTIIDLLNSQSNANRNEIFAVEVESKIKITFGELADRVNEFAKQLRTSNIEKNDRIAIIMENSIDFMITFYSILKINAIPIPINPVLKLHELQYLINDSGIRHILSQHCIVTELPKSIIDSKDRLTTTIDILLVDKKSEMVCNVVEDTALILYTSGSTGESKGVMLTNSNLLTEMNNIKNAHKLSNRDNVLCVLPWFHINGLVITMLTSLLVGEKMYIAKKFSVSNFWKWIAEYKITWFSGVPTIYSYLLAAGAKDNYDISSLRFARSASASLPISVLEKFEQEFHVPIIESYGITEGGSQLTSNPLPPAKRKAGSVGYPVGLEMFIADENNQSVAIGVEGEVYFKGDSITSGYLNKDDETKKAFWNGWFKTGDLGKVDEDGYLFLSGRKKELINRSGEKFSPREIDEILYKNEEVEIACAVGVPDDIYGEEVVAFIKRRKGSMLTECELKTFCENRMADFKVPKEIYFIENFPQGGNGKIQRLKFVKEYNKYKETREKEGK